jgi:hypothetical protein
MHFQDFGNGFSIFGNGFLIFGNGIFNFWKCISKILEMDFQFLEMDFQFLEMDFQFGDEFQCISLNLSNEFLIKKLYTVILIIFTFSLKTHGFSMDFVLNYYLKTLMTKQALDNYKNICGKP